jgi:DNA-binding helix-hairpin-helix protein with protein kinase domain
MYVVGFAGAALIPILWVPLHELTGWGALPLAFIMIMLLVVTMPLAFWMASQQVPLPPEIVSARERAAALKEARDQLLKEWEDLHRGDKFFALRERLVQEEAALQDLTRKQEAEYDALIKTAPERGLRNWLERHKLEASGLLPAQRLQSLAARGITSAADLDAARLATVSDLRPTLRDALLEWRRNLEASFNPEGRAPITPAEIGELVSRYEQPRTALAARIANGAERLRTLRDAVRERRDAARVRLEKRTRQLAQAELDGMMLFADDEEPAEDEEEEEEEDGE